MNNLRLPSFVLLLLLSLPTQADVTVSASMQTFHEGIFRGASLEGLLRSQLQAHFDDAATVLTAAIGASPGKVEKIVEVAVDVGVIPDDIARQCETMMTPSQLETLIEVSLKARIDPEPILDRCLALLPASEITSLLALAINNSTPGNIEQLLRVAYLALSSEFGDPFAMVKEGVLRSNAFTITGIELAEGVDELVTEIRLQDLLETSDTEDLIIDDTASEVDVFDPEPEPPLSDS